MSGSGTAAASRLLHVLEVTPGLFPDNAALAFSPDGRRFAFSAGHEASLWDVATGEPIKTWRLPEGLGDRLAFPGAESAVAFPRGDGERAKSGRSRSSTADKYPRVCRVRDLLGPEPLKPLAEIRDCNRQCLYTRIARRMENTMRSRAWRLPRE